VVGHITRGHRRSLPQFPLGESQGLKPGFAAFQPLFETRSDVFSHAR
jgi:hypothetical protein